MNKAHRVQVTSPGVEGEHAIYAVYEGFIEWDALVVTSQEELVTDGVLTYYPTMKVERFNLEVDLSTALLVSSSWDMSQDFGLEFLAPIGGEPVLGRTRYHRCQLANMSSEGFAAQSLRVPGSDMLYTIDLVKQTTK